MAIAQNRATDRRFQDVKGKLMYMHTLNGKPAYYTEGEQVSYAGKEILIPQMLVPSLKELRKQQKRSIEWRKAQGWSETPSEYGYVRIYIQREEN